MYHRIGAIAWLHCGAACLLLGSAAIAGQQPEDPMLQLIVQFVSDSDRETRAIALQQIREGAPGEAITKRLVALLPDLPLEAQVDLLGALGDRGDVAARPAVIDGLNSEQAAVRLAAVRALGALGSADDVPRLAEMLGTAPEEQRQAATQSLVRLRGDGVDQAIVSLVNDGEPAVRVGLLQVLAARNARQALPAVLRAAQAPESAVREAALRALRLLAGKDHLPALIELLKGASDQHERYTGTLAILTVCSRAGPSCASAIMAGLEGADGPSQVALMQALARAGGAAALERTAALAQNGDPAVRDEAVRMLAGWDAAEAAPYLVQLAKSSENPRYQVLAIRGLARWAGPHGEKAADVDLLGQTLQWAKRPQERRLVLGVLGTIPTPQSLGLVVPCLSDSAIANEAAMAAVMIAEKMKNPDPNLVRAVMEKVVKAVDDQSIRQRARKVQQRGSPK